MQVERIRALNLGIDTELPSMLILVEAAIEWINRNTSLEIDINVDGQNIAASVKLFIIKYIEVMSLSAGVASESISGLSQSFTSDGKSALLMSYAEELLGPWLTNGVRFVPAVKRRW